MKSLIKYLLLSFAVLTLLNSCQDDFHFNDDSPLSFSVDTLTFDTVFTSLGSATSRILVYNRGRNEINIQELKLAGGAGSVFRINVDGRRNAEHNFNNITIRGRDSMYIFVEVTINPFDSDAPVLQQDSIVFVHNQRSQRVLLEAFGQDMIMLNEKKILNDTTLTGARPYLIYGYLEVDSAKTLTLAAGTRLYFHHNANLIIRGNLVVEGTLDQPVQMRGSRLDKIMYDTPVPYHHVAGQWGGVYLLSKTGDHKINHLMLSSGEVGLYFFNSDRRYKPSLEIHNSRIHNFLFYNLVAVNGDLLVTNSEISNSAGYTIYLNGGNHRFVHCTVVNFFGIGPRQPAFRARQPAVMIMDLNRSLRMSTVFQNSVIAGTYSNELTIATKFPEQYRGEFVNSYIRKPQQDTVAGNFTNVRFYQFNDTIFKNARNNVFENLYYDFSPDSVSPLRGLADPAIAVEFPIDLRGRSRLADGKPDAGAYEWHPTAVE